jgi:hypothetical protein
MPGSLSSRARSSVALTFLDLIPKGAPLLSRFSRQGGAFDFPSRPRLLSHPRGCPVLVAFFATEPALSGAEGAGLLTSHPNHDSPLIPEGAPFLSRFLRQGGAFDFPPQPRLPPVPSSAPSIATQFPPLLPPQRDSDENYSTPNPPDSAPDRASPDYGGYSVTSRLAWPRSKH